MNQIACDKCGTVIRSFDLIEISWFGHVKHPAGGITTEAQMLQLCSNACLVVAIRERGGSWS